MNGPKGNLSTIPAAWEIGTAPEHVTQDDPERKARLMKGLDEFLERDRDRELFDLSPNKENTYGS